MRGGGGLGKKVDLPSHACLSDEKDEAEAQKESKQKRARARDEVLRLGDRLRVCHDPRQAQLAPLRVFDGAGAQEKGAAIGDHREVQR